MQFLAGQHAVQLCASQKQGEAAAAETWQSKLSAAAEHCAECKQRIRQLKDSLADARAKLPWTPTANEASPLLNHSRRTIAPLPLRCLIV